MNEAAGEQELWRALANPVRRQLLDSLAGGPRTTGELSAGVAELSRFAVMQHLGVLTDAGLVIARRRGRERFNHLNAAPLRAWYERWVTPLADRTAGEVLALQRAVEDRSVEGGGSELATLTDEFRTVRIETELRFRASAQRVWDVLVSRSREWFPATYGEERVKAIVLEPRVGGLYYEDWGEGRGHLYGVVSAYDAPLALAYRGRLDMGTILDTEYALVEDGDSTVLRVSKVAVGPISEDDAAGIAKYGDIANFEAALRKVIEGG
jgi:DNA-binding transcriptional ArsR family regulator